MFTTKYMKTQPMAAKRPTKKFSNGGYVDREVQSDEDMVDEQMAKNRFRSNTDDYAKDSKIAVSGPDRGTRYSPERAIDSIVAQGRQKSYDSEQEKDAKTSVRGSKKR